MFHSVFLKERIVTVWLRVCAHTHTERYSCTYTEVTVYSTQPHCRDPTHWYTHQENKYKLKGQGELYLHKQVGGHRAQQMKQRVTINARHSFSFSFSPSGNAIMSCQRIVAALGCMQEWKTLSQTSDEMLLVMCFLPNLVFPHLCLCPVQTDQASKSNIDRVTDYSIIVGVTAK